MNKQLSTRNHVSPFEALGLPIFNSLFTDPFAGLNPFEHSPRVNMKETENGREYTYSIPGTPPDAIDVQVEGEFLKVEVTANDDDWHEKVLSRVRLARSADVERVSAKYENGVLTVTIPHIEQEKRKVQIEYHAPEDKAIEAK